MFVYDRNFRLCRAAARRCHSERCLRRSEEFPVYTSGFFASLSMTGRVVIRAGLPEQTDYGVPPGGVGSAMSGLTGTSTAVSGGTFSSVALTQPATPRTVSTRYQRPLSLRPNNCTSSPWFTRSMGVALTFGSARTLPGFATVPRSDDTIGTGGYVGVGVGDGVTFASGVGDVTGVAVGVALGVGVSVGSGAVGKPGIGDGCRYNGSSVGPGVSVGAATVAVGDGDGTTGVVGSGMVSVGEGASATAVAARVGVASGDGCSVAVSVTTGVVVSIGGVGCSTAVGAPPIPGSGMVLHPVSARIRAITPIMDRMSGILLPWRGQENLPVPHPSTCTPDL